MEMEGTVIRNGLSHCFVCNLSIMDVKFLLIIDWCIFFFIFGILYMYVDILVIIMENSNEDNYTHEKGIDDVNLALLCKTTKKV